MAALRSLLTDEGKTETLTGGAFPSKNNLPFQHFKTMA